MGFFFVGCAFVGCVFVGWRSVVSSAAVRCGGVFMVSASRVAEAVSLGGVPDEDVLPAVRAMLDSVWAGLSAPALTSSPGSSQGGR